MTTTRRPFSLLSSPWLVSGSSLAVLVILGVILWSPWSRPTISAERPLLFYCAEGMTTPVKEIVKEFEREFGVSIHVTYDGSGKLLSTMTAARGKGDLYLAADASHMLKAQSSPPGEPLVREAMDVAVVRPVLIVNKRTHAVLKNKPVESVKDLLRRDFKHVVLANPELASIGYMTQQVLEPLGVWEALEEERKKPLSSRVSHVGTVNQVAQNVQNLAMSIGIVWDGVARQIPEVVVVEVPELAKVTERMQIGVLSKSRQPTVALQFARYLTAKDKGQKILQKHSFTPIDDADVWDVRPEIWLSAGAMLKPGIDKTIKEFAEREGITVHTTYAGCGLLASQMQALKSGGKGRFPDAYFSCDNSFMDDVAKWFDPKSRKVLTRNDVVMIVPKGNPRGIKVLDDLKRAELKRIGMAHPVKSALGKVTVDLLEKNGFREKDYDPKWNGRIRHADAGHTLVNQIGSLDVAIVYRSNAESGRQDDPKAFDMIEIKSGKELASQPFAIALESQHKHLVRRLMQAITRPESAERFRKLGFTWVYEEK